MKIVTVNQIQAIEKSADASGLSYEQMMSNAGRGVAEWLLKHLSLEPGVVGLIGSGNNGGDTLIALTRLAEHGVRTMGFLVKQRDGDKLVEGYLNSGGKIVEIYQSQNLELLDLALSSGVVILDGILGTGIKLPLRADLYDLMAKIHRIIEKRSETRKIAIDCPSGVDCDTGEVSDVTIPAEDTLCMAAVKQGLLRQPGRSYTGRIHCINIGITSLSEHISEPLPEMINADFVKKNLPHRPETGHKGTFGTCVVIAGTVPYTGAAYLAGKAAYRAGCGLVHVATLREVHQSLSGKLIEAVWTVLPGIGDGYLPEAVEGLVDPLENATSLVLGPGWGLKHETGEFLDRLLDQIPANLPTLIDADGLKLLSRLDRWWTRLPNQTILTPHPGEMAVLTGLTTSEIQANRWEIAQTFAEKWGVTLVLKGAMTVVASPDSALYVIPISDSAMATAGSGDVLSGVIGGLLAQGADTTSAGFLGAWLHAHAGEIAHAKVGSSYSVTAMDILDAVANAFRSVAK